MESFVKTIKVSDLEENKGKKFNLDEDTEIAIFKVKGNIYVVDNICPHNHTPKIYNGFVYDETVVCPVHFYEFNLKTGDSADFEGGKLRIFEYKIEDDYIYVKPQPTKVYNFDF